MITTCTGCHARYSLDADKVPHRTIRVRCPECAAVFELDGTVRDAAVPAAPSGDLGLDTGSGVETGGVVLEQPAAPSGGSLDLELEPAAATTAPEPAPEPEAAPASAARDELQLEPATPAARVDRGSGARPETATAGTGVAVADAPKQGRRRRRDKSEMLARALVSDILVYNREARDKALAAGNLLEALGPEIKKSWELYKEKVGAEAATGTSHFKDALNEILAEGQDIF